MLVTTLNYHTVKTFETIRIKTYLKRTCNKLYWYSHIDLIHSVNQRGFLVSLDVKNTNVLLNQTEKVILHYSYNKGNLVLMKLFEDYVKTAPNRATETIFWRPNGAIYRQIDAASKRSPLCPFIVNYYIAKFEINNLRKFRIILTLQLVANFLMTFFMIRTYIHFKNLNNTMLSTSILHFTCNVEESQSIPFIDVDIKKARGHLQTSLHIKKANSVNAWATTVTIFRVGIKYPVINFFLSRGRAYNFGSNWPGFKKEFMMFNQQLTDLNFLYKR